MRRILPLMLLAGAMLTVFCLELEAQERRRLRPSAPPMVETPAPAEKLFDGKLRERILLSLVRHRAVAQMQKDGFKSVGGKAKPMTKEEAEAAYDRLTDDVVIGLVKEASPKTWVRAGSSRDSSSGSRNTRKRCRQSLS